MSEGVILVIEDNPLNLKLVRDVLTHAGYDVLEAMTAEDGIALAQTRRPDLVLMDIQLPGMDGLGAVKQLKQDQRTGAIPVLAVTAYAMKGDREHALDAGFDGYLAKPIDVRALRAAAQSFIGHTDSVDD